MSNLPYPFKSKRVLKLLSFAQIQVETLLVLNFENNFVVIFFLFLHFDANERMCFLFRDFFFLHKLKKKISYYGTPFKFLLFS